MNLAVWRSLVTLTKPVSVVVLTRLTILTWLKLLRRVLVFSLMGTRRAHLFTAGNEPLKKENLMQRRGENSWTDVFE